MHSGQTSCKVKYHDSLQRQYREDSRAIREVKLSPAIQRWLQEGSKESYFIGLSPSAKCWDEKSSKKDPRTPLSISPYRYNLPTRIATANTEKAGGAIGGENPAVFPLPQQPSIESPDSTETENSTSADRGAIEPDELKLLARKVYTVLGSAVN
jgi:hypothetical protein